MNFELHLSFVLDVKNTSEILEDAWCSVEPETIPNYKKHAGFFNGEQKKTDPIDNFFWNTLNKNEM